MDSDTTTRTPRAPLALGLALLLAVAAILGTLPSAGAATTTRQASTARVAALGCSAYPGAKALGAAYRDAYVTVYACGVRPSFDGAKQGSGPHVLPFTGSRFYYRGFQCIELVARYLKARYNADPGVANGAQAVDRYAAAYPATFVKIANGTRKRAPRKGDVLSLSASRRFNDVGHTGIVVRSKVNARGNGRIRAVEQNWGGAGGARGYHVYKVRHWKVKLAGLPYVKWLHAR